MTELGDRHAPVSVIAMGEIRTRPLVTVATEVRRHSLPDGMFSAVESTDGT
jgi:hypothetical protein